jgi:ABC-type lipoprotein release transport system permease subunit
VRSARPLSRSHTFSVWSSEAETARFPSAVSATLAAAISVSLLVTFAGSLLPAIHAFQIDPAMAMRSE